MAGVFITIDGEPVAKGRPRFGRLKNGAPVAFTPAHTRRYEDVIRLAASRAMDGRNPFDGPLGMTIRVILPVPASWSKKRQREALEGVRVPAKKPDADNFVKALMDGLNTIVFRDDSLVVDLAVSKRYGAKPRIEANVFEIEGATC
jgi:Holliday junction resolvase RusA-like endonuclease